MTPALETKGLIKRFGGLVATDNVTFRLEQGARHAQRHHQLGEIRPAQHEEACHEA